MLIYIQHHKLLITQAQNKRGQYLSPNIKYFSTSTIKLSLPNHPNHPALQQLIDDRARYGYDEQGAIDIQERIIDLPSNSTTIWRLEDKVASISDDIPRLEVHALINSDDEILVINDNNELDGVCARLAELIDENHEKDDNNDNNSNRNNNNNHNNDNNNSNDNNDNPDDNSSNHNNDINSNDNDDINRYANNTNFTFDFTFLDIYFYHEILYLPTSIKYIILAGSIYKLIKNSGIYLTLGIWFLTLYRAINDMPNDYKKSTFLLNSDLLNLSNNYNNALNTLKLFSIRSKKDSTQKTKQEKNNNYAGKPKHYPPANKEWFNSIYAYNSNTIKLLPATDKTILKLIKSYFNFYSRKLEKKVRSRRLRIRFRRLSTNRMLVSRPEIKHTNDKVIITLYVYNRQNKYYLNKIKRLVTIDQLDEFLSKKVKKVLKKEKGPWPSTVKMSIIKEKSLIIRSKINKQKEVLFNSLNIINKTDDIKSVSHETNYLKHYIIKSLRKEIFSVYFRQLISFNKSKFEERYLLPLTSLVERVYNKNIEFNFVNLKYLYLNSYIFSQTLVTKLRNRKNRFLRVLKTSLLMFKLPPMDRLAVYDEIYNKKWKLQNIKIDSIVSNLPDLKQDTGCLLRLKIPATQNNDSLDLLLSKVDKNSSISNLQDFNIYRDAYFVPQPQGLKYFNYPLYLTNAIIKGIRNKYVSGIRLELAGRLTRRNTAARSVFKLRYKGNIKNMDSSYKGLSAVLLRGHAKPNLQYTKLRSKIRIGSFGLKGWVNSS